MNKMKKDPGEVLGRKILLTLFAFVLVFTVLGALACFVLGILARFNLVSDQNFFTSMFQISVAGFFLAFLFAPKDQVTANKSED